MSGSAQRRKKIKSAGNSQISGLDICPVCGWSDIVIINIMLVKPLTSPPQPLAPTYCYQLTAYTTDRNHRKHLRFLFLQIGKDGNHEGRKEISSFCHSCSIALSWLISRLMQVSVLIQPSSFCVFFRLSHSMSCSL